MANPKFQIITSNSGHFYFRLVAGNGEFILQSEGYTTRQNCEHGINSVRVNAADGRRFKELTSRDNRPYFVLLAANGEVIGTSQMYSDSHARFIGIRAVMNAAPVAPIEN